MEKLLEQWEGKRIEVTVPLEGAHAYDKGTVVGVGNGVLHLKMEDRVRYYNIERILYVELCDSETGSA